MAASSAAAGTGDMRRRFADGPCVKTQAVDDGGDAGLLMAAVAVAASPDPLQLLFATGLVDENDRARVDAGRPVVAVSPASGRDLAMFGRHAHHRRWRPARGGRAGG
jgi:hypothetical protein